MNLYSPIGIFDSGTGGLTIANSIKLIIPNEQIIYFGDIKNMPYGNKTNDFIKFRSKNIIKFLINKKCKIIIIACNSIASNALKTIIKETPKNIKIFDVITPIIDSFLYRDYKKIGIIATEATIKSNFHNNKIMKICPKLTIVQKETPLLAEIIESGFYNKNYINNILNLYLNDKNFNNIESLILACTHYHIIENDIKFFYRKKKISIIDTTKIVANNIYNELSNSDLLSLKKNNNTDIFYTSFITKNFIKKVKYFFGKNSKIKLIVF